MKARRSIGSLAARIGVCGVLLLWIFHAIFLNEGRLAWQRRGLLWESLTRPQQWKAGWILGPRELWHTLSLVDAAAFWISVGLMGLTILLGVLRWRMVLRVQGLPLPLGRATAISMVAQFFNSFLLGSTGGDLLKAYYAARETHHKKAEAVVTVLVDRLIGLFAMLFFACLMMVPNWRLLAANERCAALSALIAAMMLGSGLIVALSFWGGLSRQWPQARTWLRRLPKGDLLERSLEACRRFGREPGFLLRVLALSMLINLVCVLQVMALAWGLGLKIPTAALLVIVPMIICLSALPITPSGLGLRENLYVLLLTAPQIHVEATKALSLSLLAYAGFLFWSVLGGWIYLRLRATEHLDEVTRPAPPVETLELDER